MFKNSSINHVSNQIVKSLLGDVINDSNIHNNIDGVDCDHEIQFPITEEAAYLSQCVGQGADADKFRWLVSREIPFILVDMENRVDYLYEELDKLFQKLEYLEKRNWSTNGTMWQISGIEFELRYLEERLAYFNPNDNNTESNIKKHIECPTLEEAVYQYIIDYKKMSLNECVTLLTFLDDIDMNVRDKIECQVALLYRLARNTKESAGWWQLANEKIDTYNKIRSTHFVKVDCPEATIYNMDMDSVVDFMSKARKMAGPNATDEDILMVVEEMLNTKYVDTPWI